MSFLEQTLLKLSELIQNNRFVNLETDGLEIKPVPTIGGVRWTPFVGRAMGVS